MGGYNYGKQRYTNEDKLLKAAGDYIEGKGGKVMSIAIERMQRTPQSGRFMQELVIRFTGTLPPPSMADVKAGSNEKASTTVADKGEHQSEAN